MVERIPALAAGAVLATYWARVMRMAWKAKRETGRAANVVPPEPLGRAIRLLWGPLVTVWVASPFVVALRADPPAPFRPLLDSPPLAWGGAAVAALSLGATWVCWRRMGRSWRMGIDPAETTELVVTGPYAWVRHPIYALSTLLALSTLAAAPCAALLAFVPVHAALLAWEARREERAMLAVHGDAYARYLAATGGFLPRSLRPYAPAA